MKFGSCFGSAAIAVGFLASVASPGGARATIINVDGISNAGLTDADGVSVTLGPGTYTFTPVQGAYTAFDRFGTVSGCDASGANCTEGWEFGYKVTSASGTNGFGDGGGNGGIGPITGGGYYSTAAAALANAEANYVVGPVTYTTPATLKFFIGDDILSDNIGGISLDISGVPEPATWAMMLIGFGGVALALRQRRDAIQ